MGYTYKFDIGCFMNVGLGYLIFCLIFKKAQNALNIPLYIKICKLILVKLVFYV